MKRRYIVYMVIIFSAFFLLLESLARCMHAVVHRDTGYLFYGATSLELNLAKKCITSENVILAIGGSTTLCPGMPQNYSWPRQLELLLRSSGIECAVRNLGEAGSDIYADRIRLERALVNCRPRIVLLCSGINDVAKGPRIKPSLAIRLNAFLLKHSLFYVTLREMSEKLLIRDSVKERSIGTFRATGGMAPRGEIPDFFVTLDAVRFLLAEQKIPLVICYLPVAIDDAKWRAEYKALGERIIDYGKKYGVPVVDMAAPLNGDKGLFLPDGLHINMAGARKEAEIIARQLMTSKLVKPIKTTVSAGPTIVEH